MPVQGMAKFCIFDDFETSPFLDDCNWKFDFIHSMDFNCEEIVHIFGNVQLIDS